MIPDMKASEKKLCDHVVLVTGKIMYLSATVHVHRSIFYYRGIRLPIVVKLNIHISLSDYQYSVRSSRPYSGQYLIRFSCNTNPDLEIYNFHMHSQENKIAKQTHDATTRETNATVL